MLRVFKSRVAQNAAWIVVCKAAQAVLGLVIAMLTARYLGPANYGLINYAASIALFAAPVAQLGFTATLVHELVADPAREGEILGSAVLASAFSSIICMGGISLFARVANPREPVTILVCELHSLLLIAQSVELIQCWFQAKLLSKYAAVTAAFAYTLVCAYQIYILLSGKGVCWYAISKGLNHMMIAAALLVIYRRLGGSGLRFSLGRVVSMLRRSWHYMLSTLMVMTFAQADRVMIKMMIGDEAMGFYSAAVVLANATDFVFLAIIDSLRPVILEANLRDENAFQSGVSALYSIVIYLAFAQSVFIALFAKPIVHLLYGETYGASVRVLRLIVWYTAFSYIGSARNIWILAKGKQRTLWIVNLSGALANILLNWFLIPAWGIEGAAFASLVTQIFVNVGMGYLLRPIRENNRLLLRGMNPSAILRFLKQQH